MWTEQALSLGIGLGLMSLVSAMCVLLMEAASGRAGDAARVHRRSRHLRRAPQTLVQAGLFLYWTVAAVLCVWVGVVEFVLPSLG